MNKEDIKIITLGDIFHNLETKEQAFKFLKYIKNQQQELERYKNIVDKAITFINIFQDEKTLTLNYNDLKHLRGILRGNDFDLMILENKLKELKGE